MAPFLGMTGRSRPAAARVPRSRSALRRCASLDAAIPWLYLHGVSTGQMRQAVAALVGEQGARGLSANVVSRLKRSWDEEYRQWCRRRLDDDWVYLWADGIYSGLRGERERLCVLVVIGVNTRGEKHFLAIEDGVRESTQSWREVLLGMKQRGFTRPAKLAVGDGALGFWAALSEVFPATRTQRCWMHVEPARHLGGAAKLRHLASTHQPDTRNGAVGIAQPHARKYLMIFKHLEPPIGHRHLPLSNCAEEGTGEKWWSETSAQHCRSGSIKANMRWRH